MKGYNALVSIGISALNNNEMQAFANSLANSGWGKIDGLVETWSARIMSENKDDARHGLMMHIMQAKMECGFIGSLQIVIAIDSGTPTFVILND